MQSEKTPMSAPVNAVIAVRREVAKQLAALARKDVGTGDEGGGYRYDYADESKHGRWVEWDDIQKLIDELSA